METKNALASPASVVSLEEKNYSTLSLDGKKLVMLMKGKNTSSICGVTGMKKCPKHLWHHWKEKMPEYLGCYAKKKRSLHLWFHWKEKMIPASVVSLEVNNASGSMVLLTGKYVPHL